MGVSNIRSSTNIYSQLSSGSKINGAADNAANLAIVEEENSQIAALDAGQDNLESQKEMLNVSDGALGSVTDYLQRIKDLSLQASNSALMSDSNLAAIQDEIDNLKQGIADAASYTSYNNQSLLDGMNTSFSAVTDSQGSVSTVTTMDSSLESLGIADYDVTGEFDISAIDKAIEMVSGSRASAGAQMNAIDYAVAYNANASYNLVGAKSNIEDLDYPQAVSEKEKERLLSTYNIMMEKKRQDEEAERMRNVMDTNWIVF